MFPWLNKQTHLEVQLILIRLCLDLAGPATFLASNIFLWEQLVYSGMEKKKYLMNLYCFVLFYLINNANSKTMRLNVFSKNYTVPL